MYVLLFSISEMLSAVCDIIALLDYTKSLNHETLNEIERQMIKIIRCALDSYEHGLEERRDEDGQDNETTTKKVIPEAES